MLVLYRRSKQNNLPREIHFQQVAAHWNATQDVIIIVSSNNCYK